MRRPLVRIGSILAVLLVAAGLVSLWLWHDRPDLASTGLSTAHPWLEASPASGDSRPVTVRWLGVTTLLFDDGETQILTDGFFSRPGVFDLLLGGRIEPDTASIEQALQAVGIDGLAAVLPVHSHYDHALDSAEVARRTGARVLGSFSTANLARGAGLPEHQIVEVEPGKIYHFGRFEVTFVVSRHMPLYLDDTQLDGPPPLPGTIDQPLTPPQPVSAWRMGGAYSIVISHPRGRALVQGSSGFFPGSLAQVPAEVVLLSVAGLSRLGLPYTRSYWQEVVADTGAQRVFPLHYEDFTRPYGEVTPFPRRVDDIEQSLGWLETLASDGAQPVTLELLPFREPVELY